MHRYLRCLRAAQAIVAAHRRAAPAGCDPQNIIFKVTPGKILGPTEEWTASKFNQGFQPVIEAEGTLDHTDLSDGAVWSINETPGARCYALGTSSPGALAGTKYTLTWGANTPPTALADGLEICFKANLANNQPLASIYSVSIDLGTGGGSGVEKLVKKFRNQDLDYNDIQGGQMVVLRYGAADGYWQMVSTLGNRPLEYLVATGTDAYAATAGPAYTLGDSLVGKRFAIKFTNANTGPASLLINGLPLGFPTAAIKKNFNKPLVAGDIAAGAILELILDDATPRVWQLQSPVANTPAAVMEGAYRNLVITNLGLAAGLINLTADELVVRNSNGDNLNLQAVSLALNASLASPPVANGYDLAWSVAAWYYIWAIYNPTTATPAGLLSLSATAPAMPTGYTYKARMGHVYASAATTLTLMHQRDREVAVPDTNIFTAKVLTTSYALLGGADATAFQTAIGPLAKTVSGSFGSSASTAAGMSIAADTTGLGALVVGVTNALTAATLDGFNNSSAFRLNLITNNLAVISMDTAARNRLNVSGYSI